MGEGRKRGLGEAYVEDGAVVGGDGKMVDLARLTALIAKDIVT